MSSFGGQIGLVADVMRPPRPKIWEGDMPTAPVEPGPHAYSTLAVILQSPDDERTWHQPQTCRADVGPNTAQYRRSHRLGRK
jgi:hypothetical protein